jgi:hypothetical protein
MVGTILVGPWTGATFPAVTMGFAVGMVSMLAGSGLVLLPARSRE